MVPPQVDDRTTEAQQERAQQLLLLQRQHHQLMLPSLLLEVPTQQGTLLGRQRVYECKDGDAAVLIPLELQSAYTRPIGGAIKTRLVTSPEFTD